MFLLRISERYEPGEVRQPIFQCEGLRVWGWLRSRWSGCWRLPPPVAEQKSPTTTPALLGLAMPTLGRGMAGGFVGHMFGESWAVSLEVASNEMA